MNFITLHRICGRNKTEPITFNVATINTIMKAQDNCEHNTVIISGNSKYMIQEKYETIIDILENRMSDSHVFSTAVLSNKEKAYYTTLANMASDWNNNGETFADKLKIVDRVYRTLGPIPKEVLRNNDLEDAYQYYMKKNFDNESRPEFLTKHMNISVEEENDG